MNKSKTVRLGAVGAACALALAACGGGTSDVATTTQTAPALAEVAPAETAPVTEAAAAPTESSSPETDASAEAEPAPTESVPNQPAAVEPVEAAAAPVPPVIERLSADQAIANAEANIDSLVIGDNVLDIEVLAVRDGSAQTLRNVVTGDRPVLLWFYSPH